MRSSPRSPRRVSPLEAVPGRDPLSEGPDLALGEAAELTLRAAPGPER
jgi:hypothetical protein